MHDTGPAETRSRDGSYWNQVAGEWQDGRDRLWRAHSDAVNSALCQRWLPQARVRRILKTDAFDEATGEGLLPILYDRADRVDVIDCAHAVAAQAIAHHAHLRATVTDARALPFADGSFDAVVSNSTLDHFEQAESITKSLQEIHRVLVPGGRLLLTLDNPVHPIVWLRSVLPLAWLMRTGLVPYYVGATLGPAATADVLTSVGFRVVEVTAVLHCPRVLAVPVARIVARTGPDSRWTRWFLRGLEAFERAERWPSRFRTGHFVAVLAERTR